MSTTRASTCHGSIARGEMDVAPTTVRDVMGRDPLTFEEVARVVLASAADLLRCGLLLNSGFTFFRDEAGCIMSTPQDDARSLTHSCLLTSSLHTCVPDHTPPQGRHGTHKSITAHPEIVPPVLYVRSMSEPMEAWFSLRPYVRSNDGTFGIIYFLTD